MMGLGPAWCCCGGGVESRAAPSVLALLSSLLKTHATHDVHIHTQDLRRGRVSLPWPSVRLAARASYLAVCSRKPSRLCPSAGPSPSPFPTPSACDYWPGPRPPAQGFRSRPARALFWPPARLSVAETETPVSQCPPTSPSRQLCAGSAT